MFATGEHTTYLQKEKGMFVANDPLVIVIESYSMPPSSPTEATGKHRGIVTAYHKHYNSPEKQGWPCTGLQ